MAGLIETLPIERLDQLRHDIQHAQDHLYALDLLVAARISRRTFALRLLRALIKALVWPLGLIVASSLVFGDDNGMGAAERKRWAFVVSLTSIVWASVGPSVRRGASDWLEGIRDEHFVIKVRLLASDVADLRSASCKTLTRSCRSLNSVACTCSIARCDIVLHIEYNTVECSIDVQRGRARSGQPRDRLLVHWSCQRALPRGKTRMASQILAVCVSVVCDMNALVYARRTE